MINKVKQRKVEKERAKENEIIGLHIVNFNVGFGGMQYK